MIRFKAVRDVKSPKRELEDGGYDFFVPKFDDEFIVDLYNLNIEYFMKLFVSDGRQFSLVKEKITSQIDMFGGICLEPINNEPFNIKIPSGIKYKLPKAEKEGRTKILKITNKSGVASNNSIITGACVCDSQYRNEIIFNLIGFKKFILKPEFKITQGVLYEVEIPQIDFIEYGSDIDIFEKTDINRGGGYGSTGNF